MKPHHLYLLGILHGVTIGCLLCQITLSLLRH